MVHGIISSDHDSHVCGLLRLRGVQDVGRAVYGERNRGYGISEALFDKGRLG
jgi:hypothetical protein